MRTYSKLVNDTADLYDLLNTGLGFKCEHCDESGYHLCKTLMGEAFDEAWDLQEAIELYVNIYNGEAE